MKILELTQLVSGRAQRLDSFELDFRTICLKKSRRPGHFEFETGYFVFAKWSCFTIVISDPWL